MPYIGYQKTSDIHINSFLWLFFIFPFLFIMLLSILPFLFLLLRPFLLFRPRGRPKKEVHVVPKKKKKKKKKKKNKKQKTKRERHLWKKKRGREEDMEVEKRKEPHKEKEVIEREALEGDREEQEGEREEPEGEKEEACLSKGVFLFNQDLALGLSMTEWAKLVGYHLWWGKEGKRNPTAFHRGILSDTKRPIFAEATWKKIIKEYKNKNYIPPTLNESTFRGK